MQMASGGSSVFDSMLEIVATVAPTENTYEITFDASHDEGAYIVISNPPGNRTNAAQQSQAQILGMAYFQITNKTSPGVRNASSVLVRKDTTSTTDIDYWTSSYTLVSEGITMTIAPGNRFYFASGVTYYLVKVKGM